MNRTIVTTSHQPDDESLARAGQAARALGAVLAARERLSLARLREKYRAENILVATREEIKLHTPRGECFFHPGLSIQRIKAVRRGGPDHMVAAMGLHAGDSVLDCTLGLGADAIVAAFVTGPAGRVVGVEASPELAYLVKTGFLTYRAGPQFLREVMSRIEVLCGDCEQYLAGQPDNSFDLVYFDPMFRFAREKSSSMNPLRGIVKPEPLNCRMIAEGLRVARRRVVMKENTFSQEFARLGFSKAGGGQYSPVAFGVIDKQEAVR